MRARVLLGMLGGGFIAFAISLFIFLNFMHHMFIVRINSPIGYILHATPLLLIVAGIFIAVRALKR